MQSVKMQGPVSPAVVPDVPSALPPGAEKSKPSNVLSAGFFLTSGETTSIKSRAGERSQKSSWIRRLKARDELELLKGNSPEAASETTPPEECQDSIEKVDRQVRSSESACFLQEKASAKTDGGRPGLNLKINAVLDTERQSISEQKDSGAVDRPKSGFIRDKQSISYKAGKGVAENGAVLLSSHRFGPWINLSSGGKPGGKSCLELERGGFRSKNVVGNVVSTQLSKQNSHSNLSLNNSTLRCNPGSTQGEAIAPIILGKPPLPPRPLSQKTQGLPFPGKVVSLASGACAGLLDQVTQDVRSNGKLLETPFSRETVPVRQVVSVQEEETSKIAEAKHAAAGLPFQKSRPSEGSFPDSTKANSKEHAKGAPDCMPHPFAITLVKRVNNVTPGKHLIPISVEGASVNLMTEQQIGKCSRARSSDAAATEMENDRREISEGTGAILVGKRSFGEGTNNSKSLGTANLSSDIHVTNLHLKLSQPEIGNPKVVKSSESFKPTASMEPRKTALQQSPSESSHRIAGSDRAHASASATASLPWEMSTEASGASKKAREQFVEVYYRARDELKNQSMRKAPATEMDDGPRLTLGSCTDVPVCRLERQSLKHQEQSAGHFQCQGRRKGWSTSLEHRTQSLGVNLKAHLSEREQHTISFAEGKVRVILPASEQGVVPRDNVYHSNSASPCRQAEGFSKSQMLQRRVNLKASQGSDQDKACQRQFKQSSDALGQIHNKGVRSESNMPNEGEHFSSNSAVKHHQWLASKLKEHPQSNGLGQPSGSQSQHNDRQEISTPLRGKRPRETFEDHAVSTGAENGLVACRERPPSKPHFWLQRWHPTTTVHNVKGIPGNAHAEQLSVKYLALGMKKFKHGDGCGVIGRATEVKNTLVDKEQGLEGLKMRSAKRLPSAAAMAIVGAAATQFCSTQPQRKGYFSFWSEFGMPAPLKVEPSQGKGKAKLCSEAYP